MTREKQKSNIWWTQQWNPITGCSPASEGCAHCYAATMAKRFWGTRKFSDIMLHHSKINFPLHWKKPRRIFVCSMADIYHENLSFASIAMPFDVMENCYRDFEFNGNCGHTFIVLTKRAKRQLAFMTHWLGQFRMMRVKANHDHIWKGVTAENQARANERIELLAETPSKIRFASFEPLLGPVNLDRAKGADKLSWIVCGAETGAGARPMELNWAISLMHQARERRIPFFFKSAGDYIPVPKILQITEHPSHL